MPWERMRGGRDMTPEQARELISHLSLDEKINLNEMLKDLAQKRRPSLSPPVSDCKDAQ